MMAVHYEPDGPIVVVTIDRPEVCNAIDRPTANALADAMRRFDEDPGLSVAVHALTREYRHGMSTLHTGETFEGIRQFGSGERRYAQIG
jgi:1,4-dihydroxy-2-naphthoyl-CoA synthase